MPNTILRRRLSQLLVALLVLAPLLSLYPPSPAAARSTVEVKYLAVGTRYQTPMYIIRGPEPGPVFMITGGVHGSEIAGWQAAWKFIDRDIRAGTFIVIPEANAPAVAARTRNCPVLNFDLNRQFPQSPDTDPTRLIALEIWKVFKEYDVKWYVDLHEALDFYKNPSVNSVGQTLIHYPRTAATQMGNLAVKELNQGISVNLHKFTLLSYPVPGSIARASGAYLGVNSYIFETSRKLTLSTRIGYQVQLVEIFLRELGMAGAGGPPPVIPGDEPPVWDDGDDPAADLPELQPGLNLVILLPGAPDETILYAWDSGVEGPVVMVAGGLRGTEPGGVAAARLIQEFKTDSGKLLVLPEANPRAVTAGTRTAAGAGDLNRAFPRTTADWPDGALATAIWQAVRGYGVDHLVTFVEGADYYLARTGEFGQTVIYHPVPGTAAMADAMVLDLNLGYDRNLAAFNSLQNPVPTSLTRAAGELLGIRAFLVELSAREPLDGRATDGARAVDSLLAQLGMKQRAYLPPPPPDAGPGVTRQVLLAGTHLATPVYIHDSGKPGPTVMVVGGLRGNEPGGILAALALRGLRVDRGRLLVLPEANRLAVEVGQRTIPGGDDLNRQFPRQAGVRPADPLAGAIWGTMQDYGVQYVLTFTEDPDYYLAKTGHFGHTLIHAGPKAVGELAAGIAADLNQLPLIGVARFTTLANPAQGSLARAAGDFLGTQAILMDLCTRQTLEARVELALRATDALLRLVNAKDPPPPPTRETRILRSGTAQATPLHIYNGPQPGPTVLVVGGLRGNERGGVEAARLVRDFEVTAGRLLVLPEANAAAVAAGTRVAPGGADLNRAFPRTAGSNPTDALAAAIWQVLRDYKVEYVLTFTEDTDYYLAKTGHSGHTLIHAGPKAVSGLAAGIAAELNRMRLADVARFTALANPVQGSLARAAGDFLGAQAILMDLCSREPLEMRVDLAVRAAEALLGLVGLRELPELPPPPAREIRVLLPGTAQATPLHIYNGPQPGPTVLVVGGLRGNEPGGVEAARLVRDFEVTAGTLMVLPEANQPALAAGTRAAPGGSDLNRAFPRTADQTPSDPLARAIWDLARAADAVVSFVEGADYYLARTGEFGQTVIYFPVAGAEALAGAMAGAANQAVEGALARFTVLRNPVQTSLARAAGEVAGLPAFLVELCRKETLANRAEQGARAVDGLLVAMGMAAPVYPPAANRGP